MQTLHSARNKLESALEEYSNACITLANSGFTTFNCSQGFRNALDAEIELLATFEQKTVQIKSTLSKFRNLQSVPANSLPDEILSRIFYLVTNAQSNSFDELVDNDKLPIDILAVSQVCTKWRQVALGSKSLWTHINLSARNQLVQLAHIFGARSGGLPLSVRAVEQLEPVDVWGHASLNELFKCIGHQLETVDLAFAQSLTPSIAGFPALLAIIVHCTPGQLARLVLSDRKIFIDEELADEYECSAHWFIISKYFEFPRAPNDKDYKSQYARPIRLDISQEILEEILGGVNILKLDQIYPFWTSKAYHGLTELRLTGPRKLTAVIGEQQFADILAASPKLRVLHFGLEVRKDQATPAPVHLEHLEVFLLQSFSSNTQQLVLRLIVPGTKPMQMSITYNRDVHRTLPASEEEEYCHFFKRSNIVQLQVHSDLLAVRLPQLLEFLPNIEVLILRSVLVDQVDPLRNIPTPPCPKLHTIYFTTCTAFMNAIQWVIRTHDLDKAVFWDSSIRHAGPNRIYTRVVSCRDRFADISPPVQIFEYEEYKGVEIEGWGVDMDARMAVASMTDYTVH